MQQHLSFDKIAAAMREAVQAVANYDARISRTYAEMTETVITTREMIARSRALMSEADAVLARRDSRFSA